MKLLESDAEVICAVGLHGDKSVKEIAKSLGMKEHTVRNALDKVTSAGIIYPYTLINPFALGVTEYQMFVSLDHVDKTEHDKFIEVVIAQERISWVMSLSGDIHYSVGIYARGPHEVFKVFDDIVKNCPNLKYDKSFSVTASMSYFNAKYLCSKMPRIDFIQYQPLERPPELDNTDLRILQALMELGYGNLSALSRHLKIPIATLTHRIGTLKEKNVIIAFGYLVKYYSVPFHPFLFLIKLKNPSSEIQSKMFEFCRSSPNVTYLITSIGAWDYRIFAHLPSPQDVISFSREIQERFPGLISKINPIPVLGLVKKKRYPFKAS